MEDFMSDSYEERVMEFEAARNEAMDSYFNARKSLIRSPLRERVFEGGFRMAWDLLKGNTPFNG
jgi:hypothetical protein